MLAGKGPRTTRTIEGPQQSARVHDSACAVTAAVARVRPRPSVVVESTCFWFRDAFVAPSIKSVEAERLARDLAKKRGTTVTRAVSAALEDALRRARGRQVAPSLRDAILEISERCAALPDLDVRPADEILGYDKRGGFR